MRFSILSSLCLGLLASSASAQTLVFSDDLNSTIPSQITPGVATITGVQQYAGLGPVGYQFGGSFLRSPTGNTVTLTLTNLPSHTGLNLDFLFAAIDSLDGTGSTPPLGDFFRVTLDGTQIFRESFANADPGQTQSYMPPPGVQLARRIDLGFSGPGSYYTDSAYNMSADPVFHNLAHTAPTAVFTFIIEGPGIQDLTDESWAMDNLRVSVLGGPSCPADFNHDGLVEDSDFSIFVVAYNTLVCADPLMPAGCPADINGDGLVDDADFSVFVVAYDLLVCP